MQTAININSTPTAGLAALRRPTCSKALFATLCSALLLMGAVMADAVALTLPDFETLVKEQGKAVVKISVSAEQKLTAQRPQSPQLNQEELPEFFKKYFDQQRPEGTPGQPTPRGRQSSGSGSGFIMSSDGYVITNAHVVDGATSITVSLPDRRQYQATLIGADERTDVALLKVDANDLPVLELGDSDDLNVGQWVLAIGSPFGFEHTATQGIVSALSRSLPSDNYVPFIQTDVAVNPGNSGGPLFSTDGKVIGVNSQIFSRSGGYMGLSFAIPSNVVRTVAAQLKDSGYVSRGWLGVMIQNVDRNLAESFGLDRPEGALIARVTENSPAEKSGLTTGDVILSFNGKTIGSSSKLPPLVAAVPVGQSVDVEVLRDRKRVVMSVTIEELAEDREIIRTNIKQSGSDSGLGITVTALSEEQRAENGGIKTGVVVTSVDPQGVAAVAGISAGDIIVSFDQQGVTSVETLVSLVKEASVGEPIAVLIQRNKAPLFTALTLPQK